MKRWFNDEEEKVSMAQRQESNELPEGFVPAEQDIICGWARQNYNHAGNRRLREIIASNVDRYIASKTKREKGEVIAQIVERIRAESPTGVGLVRMNPKTGRWSYISTEKAKDKIGHALRKASQEREKKADRKKANKARKEPPQSFAEERASPPSTFADSAPPSSSVAGGHSFRGPVSHHETHQTLAASNQNVGALVPGWDLSGPDPFHPTTQPDLSFPLTPQRYQEAAGRHPYMDPSFMPASSFAGQSKFLPSPERNLDIADLQNSRLMASPGASPPNDVAASSQLPASSPIQKSGRMREAYSPRPTPPPGPSPQDHHYARYAPPPFLSHFPSQHPSQRFELSPRRYPTGAPYPGVTFPGAPYSPGAPYPPGGHYPGAPYPYYGYPPPGSNQFLGQNQSNVPPDLQEREDQPARKFG